MGRISHIEWKLFKWTTALVEIYKGRQHTYKDKFTGNKLINKGEIHMIYIYIDRKMNL